MKLSVIIVNYNVKFFLEQCLLSVRKAVSEIEAEVFVVDNNSVDSSVSMVREKFPEVNLIANCDNRGFSRANNQGIEKAKGKYVLLLNPDTIVEEDTFSKIVGFMDDHPDAGGLGVKMVDGKGKFLPESKRGLPTPSVAFYKIFGLSKLFPKSKRFGQYHLGYLDKDTIHEVEILSGAFMLLRKEVLEKIGYLDEEFFMYGEDIDLSYRIIKAGYKNYYYPDTRIIHYKGESTKKTSVNYVKVFYNAMVIFARKHFSQKNAKLFSFLINVAIWFRALLAILFRFLKAIFLPVLDAVFLYAGIYILKNYWESHIIYLDGGQYPVEFMTIAVPLYIAIWLFSVYISGGYDRPIKMRKVYMGLFIGTVTILVIYGLLSETYRYSRTLIILGALWGMLSMTGIRLILHFFKINRFILGEDRARRFIIVGDKEEAERVAELLRKTYINPGFIGLTSVTIKEEKSEGFIGNIQQIKDIIHIYKIDEVIFCAKDMPARDIIDAMTDLHTSEIVYKIAPQESISIIGSDSISTSGDPYIIDIDSIDKTNNRRNKRFFDFLVSLICFPLIPVLIFIIRKPVGFIRNIFLVLFGRMSWIGDYEKDGIDIQHLPKIKRGVLNPTDAFKNLKMTNETINRLNILYARDYRVSNDLNIIYKRFRGIGN